MPQWPLLGGTLEQPLDLACPRERQKARSSVATRFPVQLTRRLYSYADSDRMAGVGKGTSKRWIEGYTRTLPSGLRTKVPPVTPGRVITGEGVSFADLVEIVAIGRFKELGFSVKTVRRIVEACQAQYEVQHPLSSLEFKAGGRDVFVKDGTLLHGVLKRKAQPAWDSILGPFLETLDYRDSFAHRWWPLGKDRPIVIDPEYGYGLPVVAGSGVRTEIISERVKAGDRPDEIAYDFNVSRADVDSAIQYELQRAS